MPDPIVCPSGVRLLAVAIRLVAIDAGLNRNGELLVSEPSNRER